MTFNEADQFCQVGYGYGAFPPGIRQDGIDDYLCGHTVLKAHAKAYHIYDEEFRATQNGRVSMVVDTEWYEPASDSDQDKEAADRKLQFTVSCSLNLTYWKYIFFFSLVGSLTQSITLMATTLKS
jgi:beta-glucosidase/6-phospho-beta-glucosidase/beta-galactosidase